MKTSQLLFLLLSLFFLTKNAMAQDDFYKSSDKKSNTTLTASHEPDSLALSIFDENNYLSFQEFNETKRRIYQNDNEDVYYSEEKNEDEHCQKTSNGKLSGEIVAEIFYNVAFTFLIIWGSR